VDKGVAEQRFAWELLDHAGSLGQPLNNDATVIVADFGVRRVHDLLRVLPDDPFRLSVVLAW